MQIKTYEKRVQLLGLFEQENQSLREELLAAGRALGAVGAGPRQLAPRAEPPSTGTHAHTEHLFTPPMDVQGAFAVINWGRGGGRRGRKAFGCLAGRLGEERKMNSLSWHLPCHQPCGLSLWL